MNPGRRPPATLFIACTLAGASCAASGPVRAETVATAQAGRVETVVVTSARLRDERPQDVPIALTSTSGETLAKIGADDIEAVARRVPSLAYVSANPRNTSISIRGLGSSVVAIAQANDGLDPGVSLVIDQVPRARPAAGAFDFVDPERLEVLRGPQGTLFGRNATAGAIVLTSRAPTFAPEGLIEVSVGTMGRRGFRAMASGPLIDDVLAARVAVSLASRDGLLRNVTVGATTIKATRRFAPRCCSTPTVRGARGFRPTSPRSKRAAARRRSCAWATRPDPRRAAFRPWRRRSDTARPAPIPSRACPTSTRRCVSTRRTAASAWWWSGSRPGSSSRR